MSYNKVQKVISAVLIKKQYSIKSFASLRTINFCIVTGFSITLFACATYSPKPLPLINAKIYNALKMSSDKSINKSIYSKYKNHIAPIDFNKPLTSEQLALIAVITNPDLIALRVKNNVAAAQVFDAGLLPDPQFNPIYEIPTSAGNGITPAYSYGLTWDIGSIVTLYLKESAAKYSQKQVQYNIAWQEWLIANQAELLATQIYFIQKQNELLRKEINFSDNNFINIRTLYKQHNLRLDEFSAQQSNYLDLQDQFLVNNRLLDKTKIQLNKVLGAPPDTNIKLAINPNDKVLPLSENDLFNYAVHHRLDLLALQAGYNNQEVKLNQAILGQFPHFNLYLYPGQDNTSNQYFGINITLDLPIFNRNRGAIAIGKATREQLYQEYIARLQSIRSDIATINKEIYWASKQESIIKIDVPFLNNIDLTSKAALKANDITLTKYMSIHSNVLNKQLKLLALQQDLAEQKIGLQILLGKFLGN